MTIVVYADLTTPESLVASLLTDPLLARGVEVDWRAVSGRQAHLVLTAPLPGEQASARADRVHALAQEHGIQLPDPWGSPTVQPSDVPGVAALAEAACSGVLTSVRQRLYRAYWMDRIDIGNPDALRPLLSLHFLRGIHRPTPLGDFGYAVAIGGGPVSTLGWRQQQAWRTQWVDAGEPELPAVSVDGAAPVSGQAALQVLADALPDPEQSTGAAASIPAGSAPTGAPGGALVLAATADPRTWEHERWLRGRQRRSWRWSQTQGQSWWTRPDP